MIGKSLQARVVSLASVLVLIGGCQVATDLVNPNLFSALNIDPETISPTKGRIVIAFNNTSQFLARFHAVTFNAGLTSAAESIADVGSDQTGNSVIDCPIEAIEPGQLVAAAAGGTTTAPTANAAMAIEVTTTMGILEVPYAGSVIQSGRDFQCGDVVEIRLVQTGAGTAATDYRIIVTVRAGQ